jgi:hypothetical protein
VTLLRKASVEGRGGTKANPSGNALSALLRQAESTFAGLRERTRRDRPAAPRFESLRDDEFEQDFAVPGHGRFRLVVPVLILLVAIAVGGVGFWLFYGGGSSSMATPRQDASNQFAPLAQAPDMSQQQQQALDQVQTLQQDLAAQQAETRRLSDGLDILSRKVDALQQSFASTPVPAARVAPPKRKPAALPPPSTRLAPFIQ